MIGKISISYFSDIGKGGTKRSTFEGFSNIFCVDMLLQSVAQLMCPPTSAFPELVCLYDNLKLELNKEHLRCGNGHGFRVVNGIPRFVPMEGDYTNSFGFQWTKFARTQLDSYTGTRISRDRSYRCMGEGCLNMLIRKESVQVLEAGCGAGRFTEVLLDFPGTFVTSVDYSTAVDVNQANFPQSERHRVIQADILRFPFQESQYDLVLCLGVVQHTPSPESAIAALYKMVKPGGWLVIDHYTYSLSRATKIWSVVRPVLKRLPPELSLKIIEGFMSVFLPVHRGLRNYPLLQKGFSRISPLLTYYHAYPELSESMQYEWAFLDTFDHLTDWYKHLRTPGQIRRVLDDLGAKQIYCARNGNGIEARGLKP